MYPHISSNEEYDEAVEQEVPATKKRRGGGPSFTRWDREDQLRTFFAWLPQELHDAPSIDWAAVAPEIMGYLVRTIGNSPDAVILAVATASVHGAMDQYSQYIHLKSLGRFLKDLRATTPMQCLEDLKEEQIWFDWATKQAQKEDGRKKLGSYVSHITGH